MGYYMRTYQFETFAIGILLAAFAMLMVGKSQNYKIAEVWHNRNVNLLQEQFAYVGTNDKGADKFE